MDKSPTPREWKAIIFFALYAMSGVAAICAIIEMSVGKARYFTGAAALILGFQAISIVVTKINDWTDARRAKRPPDDP